MTSLWSRKAKYVQVPGWIERSSQSCPPPASPSQVLFSGIKRMVQGYPFPAPCPSWTTTPSWAASTEEINSGAITAAERNAESFINIFHFLLDMAITNAFILQKGYCEDAPFSSIKEFRLKLASELIGDYCSRRRAGRSGVVRSLPL